MKEHSFVNATKEQVDDLKNHLTRCVATWCKENDCAGSTAEYNLYTGVQDVIQLAWENQHYHPLG